MNVAPQEGIEFRFRILGKPWKQQPWKKLPITKCESLRI